MTDKRRVANAGYSVGRRRRAIDPMTNHPDADVRARAAKKAERWRAVIAGIWDGTLSIGSRTPVADTPAWVTLEVAHGGFATGRYLAEGALLEHERALLGTVRTQGTTDRERLNFHFLGNDGLETLIAALDEGRYTIDVPEEGALLVVAWLVKQGGDREGVALDLIEALRPLMHRLRFYPRLEAVPRPTGACVRLRPAGKVAEQFRTKKLNQRVAEMNEVLGVWAPLYDRLVDLWLDTVEGGLPRVSEGRVTGGWPCRKWPSDWGARRAAWLASFAAARREHRFAGNHTNAKSNFSRLVDALERCEKDSAKIGAREVGWVRRALANTITKHGAPGSDKRTTLRQTQSVIAARPTHASIAQIVARRLDAFPSDGGLPSVEPIMAPVGEGESRDVSAATVVPAYFERKVARALEAPIEELMERGVIGSSEVLAIVLPQITAQVAAAGIEDAALRDLYGRIYAAFRRRRSLLLLNLEHQVRLEELPWVGVLASERAEDIGTQAAARQTLEQAVLLALNAFPWTILPNPLVREIGALAERAGLKIPLVEELASDIFMGTFTMKWADAGRITCERLEGSLYGRYYDLPAADAFAATKTAWGRETAEGFATVCAARAEEAVAGDGSWVAKNGTLLEQSQILTTQNLLVLAGALDLQDRLRTLAPSLVERTFAWIVRRQAQRSGHYRAKLQMVKNTAYAWRQAIFFMTMLDVDAQLDAVARLEATADERFGPAVRGLRLVVEGGHFDNSGRAEGARRFLGWSVGPHWLLEDR